MYKVFINDKPIILTDSVLHTEGLKVYDFDRVVIDEILHKIKKKKIKGIALLSHHVEIDWKTFLTKFKIITAAGGLVLNEKKEFLFIYRAHKWDLPKGRVEDGEDIKETAVREVEEECGVTQITLEKFLTTTYHIFFHNKERRIKETHWFLMSTKHKTALIPQLEEGITDVAYKNATESKIALENSYANIKLVFDCFYQEEIS
jgi:ADP-ribose pyrophosphatase YjhB (NUDIX family)